MKKINLGNTKIQVPAVIVGCMGISELSINEVQSFIEDCMEQGLYFFDHADIYGNGVCEEVFAKAMGDKLTGASREDFMIQSKCGIIPGKMYDLSKKHILESTDAILKRLNTEYIDILLLHALML